MQDPTMRVALSCKESQWGVVQLGEVGEGGQSMDIVEPNGGRDGGANAGNRDDALCPLGRWGQPDEGGGSWAQEGAKVLGGRQNGEGAPLVQAHQ